MALLYLLSIYAYFFMSGRLYWIIYCLFMPNFFLLGPLYNVNFTANLASRGFIGIFDHIFYGYSNRQLHFPHINIAHIVSWTSNHATYDVYLPEVVETLIHVQ